MIFLGFSIIFFPNALLGFFRMELSADVWIRVLGVVLFVVALYYGSAALQRYVPVYKMSVWGRMLVGVTMCLYAYLGLGEPQLYLFAFMDLAVPLWTYLSLKKAGI